jgi:hypothetical protein
MKTGLSERDAGFALLTLLGEHLLRSLPIVRLLFGQLVGLWLNDGGFSAAAARRGDRHEDKQSNGGPPRGPRDIIGFGLEDHGRS